MTEKGLPVVVAAGILAPMPSTTPARSTSAPGDARRVDEPRLPVHDSTVATSRRVTANLPADLVEEALRITGSSLTQTLTEGLRLVKHSEAYAKARRLKGKILLDVDLSTSRERGGR
jgi:hypothetical protein